MFCSTKVIFGKVWNDDYRHLTELNVDKYARDFLYNTDVSTTVDIKSSTLCYKDGPRLPPLNFTATCIMFGRYVIYYNERRREVTYPEQYELNNVCTECVKSL